MKPSPCSRFSSQCVRRNSTAGGMNDVKNLGVIRYHPEIEDVIRPVGVAPLDLPTDDQITHAVADIVLAVNDEHYSVLYLGTGQCDWTTSGCILTLIMISTSNYAWIFSVCKGLLAVMWTTMVFWDVTLRCALEKAAFFFVFTQKASLTLQSWKD